MTKKNGKPTCTAASILSAVDTVIEPVNVPQWGGTVYVRSMTLPDYTEVEFFIAQQDKTAKRYEETRILLLSKTLCDADGNLLFTDPDDIEALKTKNAGILDRLWEKACDLNNIGASAQKLLELIGLKKSE